MIMNTSSVGVCRCLVHVPVAHFNPVVECCVVYGSGKVVVMGMVSPAVEEQVQLATGWVRLHRSYIKTTLNVEAFKIELPLPADRDLIIHVSPGSAGAWKNQTLGGAISIALVSMMTGLLPKADMAVAGELCGCTGVLGNIVISAGSSLWSSISGLQGIQRVVLGRRSAEEIRTEAIEHGVTAIGVDDIASALSGVFND